MRDAPDRGVLGFLGIQEYLSENDVKSRFGFGRDAINYLADLLSDDLARNTAFRYAPRSPGGQDGSILPAGDYPLCPARKNSPKAR